jgi:hypothetical protein
MCYYLLLFLEVIHNHKHTHTHDYIYIYMYIYIYNVYTCVCKYMYCLKDIQTQTLTHRHAHTHTPTHTYTHTYIYVCVCVCVCLLVCVFGSVYLLSSTRYSIQLSIYMYKSMETAALKSKQIYKSFLSLRFDFLNLISSSWQQERMTTQHNNGKNSTQHDYARCHNARCQ